MLQWYKVVEITSLIRMLPIYVRIACLCRLRMTGAVHTLSSSNCVKVFAEARVREALLLVNHR